MTAASLIIFFRYVWKQSLQSLTVFAVVRHQGEFQLEIFLGWQILDLIQMLYDNWLVTQHHWSTNSCKFMFGWQIQYTVDISDNENISSSSYWSLPFPKKEFRKSDSFGLRRMLHEYKYYFMKDPGRLEHLPGLSGLQLGCANIRITHGHALVLLFEELKVTKRRVFN